MAAKMNSNLRAWLLLMGFLGFLWGVVCLALSCVG